MKLTRHSARRRVGVLALFSAALLAQPVMAQQVVRLAELPLPAPANAISASRDGLSAAMTRHHVPGASVAVWQRGRIIWAEGLGFADLENRSPVTTATRFRIGSVSKSLTAVLLAVLHDDGLLELDEPVGRLVDDLPAPLAAVTPRQLGGHTAGIRHYRPGETETLATQHFPTVADGLKLFVDDPLQFTPGTRYFYSSYGYNLLSAALEEAARQPFLEAVQSRVLDPLGMTSTVADHPYRILDGRTRFYARFGAATVNAPFVDNSYKWAGGGFLAPPSDLVRLGAEILRPSLIKPETARLLTTGQVLPGGKATGYGIGFFDGLEGFTADWNALEPEPPVLKRARQSGRRLIEHRGGSVGGSAVLLLSPDADLVIALAWNQTGAGDYLMAEALAIEERFAGREIER